MFLQYNYQNLILGIILVIIFIHFIPETFIDDDVTGTCNKYESALPAMSSTSSNLLPNPSSNTSLFVFENCGSSSAIEELNFSVLHNVNQQSNLSSETRKLLKKR